MHTPIHRLLWIFLVGFFCSALFMQSAQAAPCTTAGVASADISNNVTNNVDCEVGTTNNDSQTQVNTDSIFGFNEWAFAEKINFGEGPEQTIDIGLSLTGDETSGTWAINDGWDLYTQIMLVFKGGQGQIAPSNYVAYWLVDSETSGTYQSPFANLNNANATDISHVSAYVLITTPLPGALPLFGSVLGLVGLLRWRRRRNLEQILIIRDRILRL
jgi:hypothetical protein